MKIAPIRVLVHHLAGALAVLRLPRPSEHHRVLNQDMCLGGPVAKRRKMARQRAREDSTDSFVGGVLGDTYIVLAVSLLYTLFALRACIIERRRRVHLLPCYYCPCRKMPPSTILSFKARTT